MIRSRRAIRLAGLTSAALGAAAMGLSCPTAALAQSDNGGGHTPVTLCHLTGNGSYVVITVDSNAARNGHANHGDVLPGPAGQCPTSGAEVASFAPFVAELPDAGGSVQVLLGLGMSLAAGGGALLALSRRRSPVIDPTAAVGA